MKKHLTEESGWVPAKYLKDQESYLQFVRDKLQEKIDKLPTFDRKHKSPP